MRKQNLRLRVPSKLFMLAAILTLGFGNASCSRPKTPQEKENAAQDSTIAEETMTHERKCNNTAYRTKSGKPERKTGTDHSGIKHRYRNRNRISENVL